MSTTDPRTRLRRRPWFLPVLRAVLWTLSGTLTCILAFLLVALPGDQAGWLLGCAAVPILLAVAVSFTDVNTGDPARQAHYPWAYLTWMFGLWACCLGAGLLLGRIALSIRSSAAGFEIHPPARLIVLSVVILLLGAAALLGAVLLRSRAASRAERARSIRLTGPRVPAVVTETTPNRGDSTTPLWNVTLRFTDPQGRLRWHTLVHHTKVPVGSRQWIRFDPTAPSRRSTLFVEWTRR